ncbi:MAG: purine-nucleoside phosphorylase [Acidimicrobiia bacterium]
MIEVQVYERLEKAAGFVRETTGRDAHDIGLVLGSGLGGYASGLDGAIEIPYGEIPGFPAPKVAGHAGTLVSAAPWGRSVLVASGRVHAYEGWDLDDVVFGVRTLALSGCRMVLLTNAAGGIGDGIAAGDLVVISDHINLAARNPLAGPNDERLGPRFPDLSDVYTASLRKVIAEVSHDLGLPYRDGVYAWMLGPSYESPAEIQMLKGMGASLVGMSTVPEAIALAHMGVAVAGISLVTNLAAGIAPAPLSHEEVTAVAAEARGRFATLIDALLPELAAASS